MRFQLTTLTILLAIAAVTLAAASAEERAKIEALVQWVNERGFDTSKLYVNYDAPLRGMFAKVPIAKDEVFLTIPEAIRITPEVMRKSEFYRTMEQHPTASGMDEHIRSGLWLLEQKRDPNSEWKVWLNTLPRNFSNPQIVCSEDSLSPVAHLSEGYQILAARVQSQQYLEKVLNYLNTEYLTEDSKPFARGSISFDELQWAWYAVRTRSWTQLQIPFADMFNHHPDGPLPGNQAGTPGFEFRANKDIAAGEEVFISYGPKGNVHLWSTYGFMLPNNPHTCVATTTDPASITNSLYQSFMSSRSDFFIPTANPCVNFRMEGLSEMVHDIRLQLLTKDDLNEGAHRISYLPSPISLLNEARSYREILVFFEGLRKKLLETLEEEQALREKYAPDTCPGMVLALRNEYRELVPAVMNEILNNWRSILQSGSVSNLKSSPDAPYRDQQRLSRVIEQVRNNQF